MQEMIYAVIGIISMFFIVFVIKQFLASSLKQYVCALCTAVCLTWITLLVFYWQGILVDKTLIALLMGNTMLGFFYIVERNVKKELTFFRLPFYLTLLLIALLLLGYNMDFVVLAIIVTVLWVLFMVIYFARTNTKIKGVVQRIIECCRNW